MYTQQFFIEGLGCASYLIGCEGAGVAAVIDPDRAVEPYVQAAEARGLRITHIIETHLHADHVSGNTDLAERTGATIYVHELANAEFPHVKLKDGDVLKLGNVHLRVQHTPGHTPESITLWVADTTRAPEPWMAFTGDTLFVGDVGRPDLVGAEAAQGLAHQLYASLFEKMLPHEDGVLIYPGHGAGSLCGKSIGSVRSTTLGFERKHNPALAHTALNEFVAYATHDLPEQPGNHKRIKAINRRGPTPLGQFKERALSIYDSLPFFQRGAALLDFRPKAEYTLRHVPGSVHLEWDNQLSNRIGFILPPDIPIVMLLPDPAIYREVVYALARVGYDQVIGYLADDLDAWQALGLPVASGDVKDINAQELRTLLSAESAPVVVDVREPWEFAQGHVPGARLIPLGDLARRVGELDANTPTVVVCASGSRSQSAAALLGQKGFKTIYNVRGGMLGWMRAGYAMEK